MRSLAWLPAALFAVSTLACEQTPSPEEKQASTVREEIEATISEIEAKTRTKARAMGMKEADSGDIELVRGFVCKGLVGELRGKKGSKARDDVASDLGAYACRERPEWLEVLQATARDQGMRGADDASLNEARDFVCDRIKESLRAVSPKNRPSLQIEGRVYDCIF